MPCVEMPVHPLARSASQFRLAASGFARNGTLDTPGFTTAGDRRHVESERVTLYGLRPDYHLPDTVAILAGYCEGLIDAFDLPRVCKQRSKPLGVRVE